LRQDFVFRGPVVRRLSAEQFADAVSRVAAPVFAGNDFAKTDKKPGLAAGAAWIWHDEGSIELSTFPAGKRWFRHTFSLPPGGTVRAARAVGTADNSFTCYANGVRRLASSEWSRAADADFGPALASLGADRTVTLAIEAENTVIGAAGLRFALAVWFEGEKAPLIVSSGPGWKTSATPAPGWEKPGFDDHEWPSAIALGPEGLPWSGLNGFVLREASGGPVRAAFVVNDPLQSALGRPERDQVNMSRPSQATLLQALTFANGRIYSAALDRGAAAWEKKVPDPQQRLTAIYRTALLRDPRPDELAFANAAPGDLLWALLAQPEFQLIR
jgi:hypothetical protein